jgi:hypothetical protein
MLDAQDGASPRMLIWIIAGIDAIAFVAGIALSYVPSIDFEAATAGAVFVVVIVTFMGLLSIAQDVKVAIAGTFVVVYFMMLLLVLLARVASEAGEGSIIRHLIDNFTGLTGVIIASYFGTVAVQTISDNLSGRAEGPSRGALTTLKTNSYGVGSTSTERSSPAEARVEGDAGPVQ